MAFSLTKTPALIKLEMQVQTLPRHLSLTECGNWITCLYDCVLCGFESRLGQSILFYIRYKCPSNGTYSAHKCTYMAHMFMKATYKTHKSVNLYVYMAHKSVNKGVTNER